MSKKTKLSKHDNERAKKIIEQVQKENQSIQKAVATDLPAYVKLKSINAKSFREFALIPVARSKGLDYTDVLFDYNSIIPPCPVCKLDDYVRRANEEYICEKCKKKFTANNNSISSNSNADASTWMKVLMCLLEHRTITETCDICNISAKNYYLIRTKLFYGMELMLKDVKLYGKIEADITFNRINYKGMDLAYEDYPDDSPFDNQNFIPRQPRERGGSYSHKELENNKVAIFTAIDEYGHSISKMVCIGTTSLSAIKYAVDKDKFLKNVPSKDTFKFTTKKIDHTKCKGKESLFISDKEKALISFAEYIGIESESHVFRRNGKQLKLSDDMNNIQRVNKLHQKLKKFLRENNYISTKYLPGYLVLFEFIQNTGASDAAIQRLFEVLSEPGLGKSASYYKHLYVNPNYYLHNNNPEKPYLKIPFNNLKACYLFHIRKDKKIKMNQIIAETGLSDWGIRYCYKNVVASGLIESIIEHFETNGMNDETLNLSYPKKRYGQYCTPEMIAVYDEYVLNRMRPGVERLTREDFVKYVNEKYNLTLTRTQMEGFFWNMARWGIRPKLGMIQRDSTHDTSSKSKSKLRDKYINEVNELMLQQKRNNTFKSKRQACEIIEKKYGLKPMYLYKVLDTYKY